MLRRWEEKVDRLCSIDSSLPMSLLTLLNTATWLSGEAGIWRPDWAIKVSNPMVLRVTVFPPVFGPVINTPWSPAPKPISIGTTLS